MRSYVPAAMAVLFLASTGIASGHALACKDRPAADDRTRAMPVKASPVDRADAVFDVIDGNKMTLTGGPSGGWGLN